MNKFKLITFLVFVLPFVSCSKYSSLMNPAIKAKNADPNPNPVFDGEVEPPMPDKKENSKSILGLDSNKNGIRDDVDIWINRTAINYNERMAMRQYAKAQQVLLKACVENYRGGISALETESASATLCLEFASGYNYKELNKKQFDLDTLYRHFKKDDCYEYFDKNSTIVSFNNPEEPWLNCNFKIEEFEKAKALNLKLRRL